MFQNISSKDVPTKWNMKQKTINTTLTATYKINKYFSLKKGQTPERNKKQSQKHTFETAKIVFWITNTTIKKVNLTTRVPSHIYQKRKQIPLIFLWYRGSISTLLTHKIESKISFYRTKQICLKQKKVTTLAKRCDFFVAIDSTLAM